MLRPGCGQRLSVCTAAALAGGHWLPAADSTPRPTMRRKATAFAVLTLSVLAASPTAAAAEPGPWTVIARPGRPGRSFPFPSSQGDDEGASGAQGGPRGWRGSPRAVLDEALVAALRTCMQLDEDSAPLASRGCALRAEAATVKASPPPWVSAVPQPQHSRTQARGRSGRRTPCGRNGSEVVTLSVGRGPGPPGPPRRFNCGEQRRGDPRGELSPADSWQHQDPMALRARGRSRRNRPGSWVTYYGLVPVTPRASQRTSANNGVSFVSREQDLGGQTYEYVASLLVNVGVTARLRKLSVAVCRPLRLRQGPAGECRRNG